MNSQRPLSSRYHRWLVAAFVIVAAIAIGVSSWLITQFAMQNYLEAGQKKPTTTPSNASMQTPSIDVVTVASGLSYPWDVDFLPDGQLLVTERRGVLSKLVGGKTVQVARITDVKAQGEGGLMGMAVDPQFSQNRFMYLCFNNVAGDIKVARFSINSAVSALEKRVDIVTGIPANPSGRHSGCRIAFGPDDRLWIGTGDSAQSGKSPQTPQDPQSLGGKILRVDRSGKGFTDNLPVPFDNRIYSYGHRNTQGLAFLKQPLQGVVGYSAEHGSSVDDEINQLSPGNFGWDPDIAYTEKGVAMTDKVKFPDAHEAVWKSGIPTQAPSGLAVINGSQWQAWNGALVMAMLKEKHIKVLSRNSQGSIIKEERIVGDKGRIRSTRAAPDGNLYITTDNGANDEIISIAPR